MQWLSFHFYPLETPDVFLARGIRPFLEHSVWPVKGTRAFFIRYEDDKGPHIRLRIRGEAEWLEETLKPALLGWFADRGEVVQEVYEPEPDRFGGTEALVWAEEHFHLSTRVTLDRMNREYTYGDAMYDGLRLHTILAFAAGFTKEKTAWYFSRLAALWAPRFFQPVAGQEGPEALEAGVFAHFDQLLQPQRDHLRNALGALWKELENDKLDKNQVEWLRWLRGNQMMLPEFGDNLEKALPVLIHLTNNRLGIHNPDEVYLSYILGKTL
jgi:thiopeptide-type bacteriocin biosynthesis protein